jgi:hypothetical protein
MQCQKDCGEEGIRTLGTLRYTRFPIVHLRPLGHPSWENDVAFAHRAHRNDVTIPGDTGETTRLASSPDGGTRHWGYSMIAFTIDAILRRVRDLNPRCFRTSDFESDTIGHSDNSPETNDRTSARDVT